MLPDKDVYPYEEKLDKTELSPKEAFYSSLNESTISNDDHAHDRSFSDT